MPRITRLISLKTKIAGIVMLLFVGSFLLLTFSLEKKLAQDMAQLLEAQQFATVSYVASDLEDKFRLRIELLNANAGLITPDLLASPEKARDYLSHRFGLLALFKAGVVVISGDGTGITDYPPAPGRAHASFRDIEYFQEVLATGNTAIGMPRIGRFTKQPGVAIAAPIKDASGHIIGVLAGFATFSDPTLFGQVEKLHVGKSGYITINAPRYSIIAASSNDSRIFKPMAKPGVNNMVDRFVSGYEGSGIAVNSLGVETLTSAKQIPSVGWFAQIVLPTEEAFAPIRSMRVRAYSILAVLSAFVLVLVWVVIWRLLAPLSHARERVSKMSSGELQSIPVKNHDEIGLFLTNFNMLIDELKRAKLSAHDSEERFRTILDNAPIGMSVENLEGKFVLVNHSLCEILGYRKDELEMMTFQEITYHDDLEYECANVQRLLDGSANCYSIEKRYIRKDRQVVWAQLTESVIRDAAGIPLYFVAQVEEITTRKQWEDEREQYSRTLETLSLTDGLTHIANRRHFDGFLTQELARHTRTGGNLSLLLLDIDHFKHYNDCYGHVSGDLCLQQVARVLESCTIRPADLVARYGGEEFACILPETDQPGAVLVAERIRQGIIDLSIPHMKSDAAEYVTASIGAVTICCSSGDIGSDIVVKADELLYKAKALGRNRVECNTLPPVAGKSTINRLMHLVWHDSYCSGNSLIDTQHQALFQVANDLLNAIVELHSKEDIKCIVTRLLGDFTQHYADEEQILEAIGYPDLEQHAMEHAKLHKEGLELVEEFMKDSFRVGVVFEYIVNEIVNHILGADKAFYPYITGAVSENVPVSRVARQG